MAGDLAHTMSFNRRTCIQGQLSAIAQFYSFDHDSGVSTVSLLNPCRNVSSKSASACFVYPRQPVGKFYLEFEPWGAARSKC